VGGSVPIFGPIFGALSLLVLPYAILTLILSIMLMLSAYWLWNLRKSGGTLAIVSLIVDMLMGLIGLAVLGLAYAPMAVIGFIIDITILLLDSPQLERIDVGNSLRLHGSRGWKDPTADWGCI
jgi:hypothetical protein